MYRIDATGRIHDEHGVIAQDGNDKHLAYLEWVDEGNEPSPMEDEDAAE